MEILTQATIQSVQSTGTHPIVHVGFDSRHKEMYDLCTGSIRHYCQDAIIKPNCINVIPNYARAKKDNESTAFVYSRFYIPYCSFWSGWAIFCDGELLNSVYY